MLALLLFYFFNLRTREKILKQKIAYRERAWELNIYKEYGLIPEDYFKMLKEQNGVCAICKQPETEKRKGTDNSVKNLSVDHCHNTNKVRQLLCTKCNHLLGLAKDDPEILKNAAIYLKRLTLLPT